MDADEMLEAGMQLDPLSRRSITADAVRVRQHHLMAAA
jgi:hypothetical protein